MSVEQVVFAIIFIGLLVGLTVAHRYVRELNTAVGTPRLLFEQLLLEPLIFVFRWLPGAYGIAGRYVLYWLLLKRLGRNVAIRDGVKIMFPGRVEIGNNSGLNDGCFLDGTGGIRIGDFVRLAPRVEIMTSNHVFADPDSPIKLQGLELKPVVIEDDVWVGIGVLVTPGVTVGKGAVVAGHAVVTRDVPPYTIVAGIPARVVSHRLLTKGQKA